MYDKTGVLSALKILSGEYVTINVVNYSLIDRLAAGLTNSVRGNWVPVASQSPSKVK